jgi:DnaK suppressor protein
MGQLLNSRNTLLWTIEMAQQQTAATAIQARTQSHLPHLTEAQIRRMDGEKYMGEAHKRCFRALLVALEELLEARAKSSAAEIAIGSAGADPIDRASAEEEHQLAIAARVRDAAQLVEVRAALKRLDADEFGWCIETGDEIGLGRLLICPTTTLCVEAQQRRESKTSRYRS